MKIARWLVVCTGAAAVLLCGSGQVVAAPWTVPSGSAANFDYAGGADLNGNFGDPIVAGNTVFFTQTAFQLNVNGGASGASAAVSDTVGFDMQVHPGFSLSFVTVTLFGQYGVTGVTSRVNANAGWDVTELSGLQRTFNVGMTTTPVSFPLERTAGSGDLAGPWDGLAEADISFVLPAPEPSMHVSLNTALDALAAPGGTADITATFQSIRFEFFFVPEPATAILLACGGLPLLLRRRRAGRV